MYLILYSKTDSYAILVFMFSVFNFLFLHLKEMRNIREVTIIH
jgi:hypothetical protein